MKLGLLTVLLPHGLRDFWITLYKWDKKCRDNLFENPEVMRTSRCRSRWCNGYRASHWTHRSRRETRRDNEFLRAIKIRSTTSFGVEVKPKDPSRNILWHVTEP
jgi:hypothetical protein